MANKMMGYVICGYNSVDNLLSEQSSPFRRWTTGSGAGSSYRHTDHRTLFSKQMSESSAQEPSSSGGQWPNGGVTRWSFGLEQLLADPAGAAAFAAFLQKEFAAENITFWYSCQKYASLEGSDRKKVAKEIWSRHLADGAPEPVNIDASARRAAISRLEEDPPPSDLFEQAKLHVFNTMKFDSYPRFLRSSVHAECARADLRGLPPPYGPFDVTSRPSTPTSAVSATTSAPVSAKVKKSASNASERRRSGGGSLLGWRRRGDSRERPDPDHDQHTHTDVVKCGTLCRVVLPDGSTSVVGVEAALAVRQVVDRLLQRRNLFVLNYDVIHKDVRDGKSAVIDVNSSSTVLGGREVVVEWRCVVRVEVGGRCVAVRCPPARALAHVLRHVLARYEPTPARRAVLRDGRPVHPDTLMQELDGARLEIVEVGEGVECAGDDDEDSLSDVALRVQDDEQSWSGSRVAGPASSRAEGAGRVRAALRPGPPLHHHPPDFLDNLRETQRQRLQNKKEPSPAPRTPPPLPPKPTTRAPTLV